MYINPPPDLFHDPGYIETIRRFVDATKYPCSRPCAGCPKPQMANSFCPGPCVDAAEALSSEPELYPIEPSVLPLVFALSRINLIQPCWSCEGHNNPDGKLWKLPQVWFYTSSPSYAHLVAKFLWDMKIDKLLNVEWRVNLSSFGEVGCATYIIEPAGLVDGAELSKLQLDLVEMARTCEMGITKIASRILTES